MTTVWVMLIVTFTKGYFSPSVVQKDALIYTTAEKCLRDTGRIREKLKNYDDFAVECVEKEVK